MTSEERERLLEDPQLGTCGGICGPRAAAERMPDAANRPLSAATPRSMSTRRTNSVKNAVIIPCQLVRYPAMRPAT